MIRLVHTGFAGIRVEMGGIAYEVDPPQSTLLPTLVTWTERERVAGASKAHGPLAASPNVLAWLKKGGFTLIPGETRCFYGLHIDCRAYPPIPYATPTEALRKTRSALRNPLLAARRLAFLATRPTDPPLALRVSYHGKRIALLGQALHRFLSPIQQGELVQWAGACDIVVAGTDFDDEPAVGTLLMQFDSKAHVVMDTVGQIRTQLGLPVRPLSATLGFAESGTLGLEVGSTLVVS